MSLGGKRAVVIGGTSGMGLATARLAAELGAAVVAAGRRPLEEREPLAGDTQARVDTTDEAYVQALFAEVGELDHLFVSSSPGRDRCWRRTFVTGGAVLRPPRHAAMVVAAFAAVEALSRALAIELGSLRVNTIRPGYTDGEMWSGVPPGERDRLRQMVAATVPVGRM